VFLKEADPAKEAEEEERQGKSTEAVIEQRELTFEAEEDVMEIPAESGSSKKAAKSAKNTKSPKSKSKSARDDDGMDLEDGWAEGENESVDDDYDE